jgi:hypothetical protein
MARYDPRGLGHAGSRAENKKTRDGQETEKKKHHVPSRRLRGGGSLSLQWFETTTFQAVMHV